MTDEQIGRVVAAVRAGTITPAAAIAALRMKGVTHEQFYVAMYDGTRTMKDALEGGRLAAADFEREGGFDDSRDG